MKSDPTDNGGLFIGRRPGTAPVRYRALPQRGSAKRLIIDRALSIAVLALMILINLLFWGPIPAGGLWVASQVQYHTDSIMLGLTVGFGSLIAVLFGGLVVLKKIDHAWILLRRAAGYDQRKGVLPVVFGVTAAIGGTAFAAWLLLIGGLGPTLGPQG